MVNVTMFDTYVFSWIVIEDVHVLYTYLHQIIYVYKIDIHVKILIHMYIVLKHY